MTWTTPKTFQVLTRLPEDDLNTYVRDNTSHIKDELDSTWLSYVLIRDEDNSDSYSHGGTAGAWNTWPVNSKYYDDDNLVTLSGGQFTLQGPAKYSVRAYATAYHSHRNRLRVRNITDTATEILGESDYNDSGDFSDTPTTLEGIIDIASNKTFELQHYIENAGYLGATNPGGVTPAVGAVIEIWRID